MSKYDLTDELCDVDTFEDGGLMEYGDELKAIKEAEKQARKEEKLTCKDRKVNYKFRLNI